MIDPSLAALLAAALLDLEVLAHESRDERPILIAVLADQLSKDIVFLNEGNVYILAPFVVPMIHVVLNNLYN